MADMPGEKTTRKKMYAPTDSDYYLSSINISYAENGVVVECGYCLKDDVKEKMQAQAKEMQTHCSFYEWESDREKHVFEDKQKARDFIVGELDEMWGDGSEDKSDGD